MATLYGVLGIGSDATAEQIERAYVSFKSKLQNGTYDLSAEEANNQSIIIRDAYTALSNPILRQRYDQKLSLANSQYSEMTSEYPHKASHGSNFGFKSIILIGAIVLGGIYLYNNNAKEREALRIAHEHEVQMKAVQVLEDRQRQDAKVQDAVLDSVATRVDTQQLRMDQQQFERESAQRQQQDFQRQRLEQQQQQQVARQEQQERQQRLQSEKRLLQQMERDRYGKVITY